MIVEPLFSVQHLVLHSLQLIDSPVETARQRLVFDMIPLQP